MTKKSLELLLFEPLLFAKTVELSSRILQSGARKLWNNDLYEMCRILCV